MLNFSTSFVRSVPWPLTPKQRLLIEALERQRQRRGRVAAYIHDEYDRYSRLIALYLIYIQRLDRRQSGAALVVTPRKLPIRYYDPTSRNVRRTPSGLAVRNHVPDSVRETSNSPWLDVPRYAATPSARSAANGLFNLRSVTSVILVGADSYCSRPRHRDGYLPRILRSALPLLPSGSTVTIVHGNARHSGTDFARRYADLADDPLWLTLDPETLTIDDPTPPHHTAPIPPALKTRVIVRSAPRPTPALALTLIASPPDG